LVLMLRLRFEDALNVRGVIQAERMLNAII
jgi:hypothetical protein